MENIINNIDNSSYQISKKSIKIFLLFQTIIGAIVSYFLRNTSVLNSIVTTIIQVAFLFAICYGLIRKKNSNVSDYYSHLSKLSKPNTAITLIISAVIVFLVSMLTVTLTSTFGISIIAKLQMFSAMRETNIIGSIISVVGILLFAFILGIMANAITIIFSFYLAETYDVDATIMTKIKEAIKITLKMYKSSFFYIFKYALLFMLIILITAIVVGSVVGFIFAYAINNNGSAKLIGSAIILSIVGLLVIFYIYLSVYTRYLVGMSKRYEKLRNL